MDMKYIWGIVALLFVASCQENSNDKKELQQKNTYQYISGNTQGTTYHITYLDSQSTDYQQDVDSLLHVFDMSLSTYKPNSIISKLNRNEPAVLDNYFTELFEESQKLSAETDGAFDITVAPLVNAWGFGFQKRDSISKKLIDSLLQYVGYQKVKIENGKLIKQHQETMLDGNAIAQGYSVDVITDFLESKACENYLVEIGGELRTKGLNPKGKLWRVGIDKPIEDTLSMEHNELQTILDLKNKSLATSGNYRKFYIKNGVKYAHSIDPHTGYPVTHKLLSATVLTPKCIHADAYATAFMVMGLEKTKIFLQKHPQIDAYLIFSNNNATFEVFYTEGIKNMIDN